MRLPRFFAALCLGLPGWMAHACTVCDSRNGQQLRAGLFDGHFVHTALLVGAPAPALVLAVLWGQRVLLHWLLPGDPGEADVPCFADPLTVELPA